MMGCIESRWKSSERTKIYYSIHTASRSRLGVLLVRRPGEVRFLAHEFMVPRVRARTTPKRNGERLCEPRTRKFPSPVHCESVHLSWWRHGWKQEQKLFVWSCRRLHVEIGTGRGVAHRLMSVHEVFGVFPIEVARGSILVQTP
jgi:hypothetical protein